MSFLSKVELKRQLQQLGVKIEGNYVRKKDIYKVLSNINDKQIKNKKARECKEGDTIVYDKGRFRFVIEEIKHSNLPNHIRFGYENEAGSSDILEDEILQVLES